MHEGQYDGAPTAPVPIAELIGDPLDSAEIAVRFERPAFARRPLPSPRGRRVRRSTYLRRRRMTPAASAVIVSILGSFAAALPLAGMAVFR